MKDDLRDVIRPGAPAGLDYVSLEELRKRTAVAPALALIFALIELLSNALDKEDVKEIIVSVIENGVFYVLKVSDDGSRKLGLKELRLILDFEHKASSKRGLFKVSRGYLGEALRAVFGFSHALAELIGLHPPNVIVASGKYEYRIRLKADVVKGNVKPIIKPRKRVDDCYTRFIVKFPKESVEASPSKLKEIIFAASMVNPEVKIKYNIFGDEGFLGASGKAKCMKKVTSIHYYTQKQFENLFTDYVRAKPDAKFGQFIALFHGFAMKKVMLEVVRELNQSLIGQTAENLSSKDNRPHFQNTFNFLTCEVIKAKIEAESDLTKNKVENCKNNLKSNFSNDQNKVLCTPSNASLDNHDSHSGFELRTVTQPPTGPIAASTPIKNVPPSAIRKLFEIMKRRAKPISKRMAKSVLGVVGRDAFERLREQNGWKRLRYTATAGVHIECPKPYHTEGVCENPDHVEFPFIIELAVFDRKEDDKDGLKVYQCVNFMASMQDIFGKLFDVSYRLGRVGITEDTPVTVVVHLVCPVLRWLNYGKTSLDEKADAPTYTSGDNISTLMREAFDKILPIPKAPKVYRPPTPPEPLSWVPHGRIGDPKYEERLAEFAREIKAIDAERTRRMKYSARGWCYLLEGLRKIHKGEFNACEKAINDCRKIGLLPIDFVAEDQDITRRFKSLYQASDPTALMEELKRQVEEMLAALPSLTTDYWEGEKYFVIMVVEKVDIYNIYEPICREYKVLIANSKGWSPIRLRDHIAALAKWAESRGLTPVLLLFYDLDPGGWKISRKFRKNLWDISRATGWEPTKIIIDRFGLNEEDVNKYNLTWIPGLKSSSGREIEDPEYIKKFGRRKCESNALLKNDETLKAAEEICRRAIEKYYGPDAKERFKKKEEKSKEQLSEVYNNPIWKSLFQTIEEINRKLAKPVKEKDEMQEQPKMEREKEVEVSIYRGYYGICPRCHQPFNYKEADVVANKVVRCRKCKLLMKLKWAAAQDENHKVQNSP